MTEIYVFLHFLTLCLLFNFDFAFFYFIPHSFLLHTIGATTRLDSILLSLCSWEGKEGLQRSVTIPEHIICYLVGPDETCFLNHTKEDLICTIFFQLCFLPATENQQLQGKPLL